MYREGRVSQRKARRAANSYVPKWYSPMTNYVHFTSDICPEYANCVEYRGRALPATSFSIGICLDSRYS